MKPRHFIAPAIALAAAAIFIGNQRVTIKQLSAENLILSERIADARGQASPEENPGAKLRAEKPDTERSPIDWKIIAESFKESEQSGDQRKLMSLQRRLMGMNAAELIKALDEIAALDLDEGARLKLEGMVIGPLSEKEPELVLERFKGRLSGATGWMSWQLSEALGSWAKKDLSAATAWLDREIVAGTFLAKSLDGKNQALLQFEGKLLSLLISTDASAAEARVAALPEHLRKELFNNFGHRELKESDQKAFAELLRKQLPADDALDRLGSQASVLAKLGEMEKVDAYLDRIGASPEERKNIAARAALSSIQSKGNHTKIKTEDIDSMREWLGSQSPGSVDIVTGESIGSANSYGDATKMEFGEAADLALRYHAAGGSDEILVGFLRKASTYDHAAEARIIAGKISDPATRAAELKKLD
ncbi:hypothetical protein HZ994_09185 [Akkermansiaceae bacterium]|nr:hypothetical protein HZ994_09185 [Akkermansiaceae bacterium]